MNHKKRDILFLTITLACLNRLRRHRKKNIKIGYYLAQFWENIGCHLFKARCVCIAAGLMNDVIHV